MGRGQEEVIELRKLATLRLILDGELLGLRDHAPNVIQRDPWIVSDTRSIHARLSSVNRNSVRRAEHDLRHHSRSAGRRNIYLAADIHFEADLDLRNPTRRWRNADELKLAKKVTVLGHRAFAFKHTDEHA
jgi:hypothetical protein